MDRPVRDLLSRDKRFHITAAKIFDGDEAEILNFQSVILKQYENILDAATRERPKDIAKELRLLGEDLDDISQLMRHDAMYKEEFLDLAVIFRKHYVKLMHEVGNRADYKYHSPALVDNLHSLGAKLHEVMSHVGFVYQEDIRFIKHLKQALYNDYNAIVVDAKRNNSSTYMTDLHDFKNDLEQLLKSLDFDSKFKRDLKKLIARLEAALKRSKEHLQMMVIQGKAHDNPLWLIHRYVERAFKQVFEDLDVKEVETKKALDVLAA